MARVSFPTVILAEFRGIEAASSFMDKTTGELRERPATLKLERELEDGDVVPIAVTLRDDVETDFNSRELKRGEMVQVVGEVNCWSGKNGGGYFLEVVSVSRVTANGKAPAPANA